MTDSDPDPATIDVGTGQIGDEPDDPIAAERRLLAALYEFSGSVLADPPGPSAVGRIRSTGVPEPNAAPNDRLRRGLELLESWRRSVDDPESAADDLARNHTRLFVGPRPKLQVHESYYADDYLGAPLARVQGSYADLGIAPADDLREEADHAAVELTALALLTRREADEPSDKRRFLRDHGWWFDDLAADVDDVADCEFYRAVASIAAGVVRLDAERHGIDLASEPPFETATDTDR